jgi:hypothetical protein
LEGRKERSEGNERSVGDRKGEIERNEERLDSSRKNEVKKEEYEKEEKPR